MADYALWHGLMTAALAAVTATGVVVWLFRQF